MALDPKIASLKAAGTYRFEFDKSQVVSIPANQTRLIVGFSKKGPFNTPVFIPDTAFFKQVFGDIDRTLEKKDSFFHRSCLTALERGPILALNLLNLDSDDQVNAVRFATAATPEAQLNQGAPYEYQKMYNRDKFFFPETDAFLTNVDADKTQLKSNDVNDLLDFTNLGQNPISVIVKKAAAANVVAFNVTAEEWYGAANVPGYLNKDSLISDFMVDVFIIEGNFGGDFTSGTPYERFAADPTFQGYFDSTQGIQRKKFSSDTTDTKLQEFFNEDEVNLIATYTACLLPNFTDLLGNNLFVENVINADTATTGLFCAVNEDLFDGDILIDGVPGGIDLIGHNLEYAAGVSSQDDVNFLSYSGAIASDLEYCREAAEVQTATLTTSESLNVTSVGSDFQLQLLGSTGDPVYDAFAGMTANTASTVGSYILGALSNEMIPVTSVNITPTTVTLVVSGAGATASGDFLTSPGDPYTYLNPSDIDFIVDDQQAGKGSIVASTGTTLYSQFSNGTLTNGDKAVFDLSGTDYTSYLVFNEVSYDKLWYSTGSSYTISDPDYYVAAVRIDAYEEDTFINKTDAAEFTLNGTGLFLLSDGTTTAPINCLNVQTLKGALNQSIEILADYTTETLLKPNQVLIDAASPDAADVIVGNYLINSEGSVAIPYSRLTRINSVAGGLTNATYPSIPVGKTALLVTCQSEINVDTVVGSPDQLLVELYYPIDSWIDYLNIFTLNGFQLDASKHVPNGTNDRQNEILSGTLSGTNLFKALTDREVINFRYLVDTFGNGIESGSKSIYTTLCQTRKNAFALINAPSAKDFKNNTDPKFLDATGALSSRLIADGGDLSLNPTVRYSLPSSTQGGSWGAFFYPYITVRDLGRNINVPPAAYTSNNFILKYENALPWSLVAGVRRGVIGGTGVVGLEINLDQEDREYLEPFGLNPIVFQSGTGPTIFANKTAQQTPKSALSSINVREVVIYIQDGIEAILKNYLFEFNTPQTRLEIKTLADNFLSTVQNDDGVFAFQNVMDESNNTPEVIDQNIGILDTFIEPVRGMEILVQRTTILKTGQISTGNFQ